MSAPYSPAALRAGAARYERDGMRLAAAMLRDVAAKAEKAGCDGYELEARAERRAGKDDRGLSTRLRSIIRILLAKVLPK